jgi:hypothetical protein
VRGAWPAAEGPAADYEVLRAAVLGGVELIGVAAERFSRLGFAGLVLVPAGDADGRGTDLTATVLGASRPRWCGRDDPREAALAAGFALLVGFSAPERRVAWA